MCCGVCGHGIAHGYFPSMGCAVGCGYPEVATNGGDTQKVPAARESGMARGGRYGIALCGQKGASPLRKGPSMNRRYMAFYHMP